MRETEEIIAGGEPLSYERQHPTKVSRGLLLAVAIAGALTAAVGVVRPLAVALTLLDLMPPSGPRFTEHDNPFTWIVLSGQTLAATAAAAASVIAFVAATRDRQPRLLFWLTIAISLGLIVVATGQALYISDHFLGLLPGLEVAYLAVGSV